MRNSVIKLFLLFSLFINYKIGYSENINYGVTNGLYYVSSTGGAYLFHSKIPNSRGELNYMLGPTIELIHPKNHRLLLDASIMTDQKLNIGIPVYITYIIDQSKNNSIGLGIFQYNGKFSQYSVSEDRTNYTYLGAKVAKKWDLGKCTLNSFIAYNLGTDVRSIYEIHHGGGGYVYFRYYMFSINLSITGIF